MTAFRGWLFDDIHVHSCVCHVGTSLALPSLRSSSPGGHVLFKMLVKGMEEQQFTLQEAFNTAVSSLACSFAMLPLLLFALVSLPVILLVSVSQGVVYVVNKRVCFEMRDLTPALRRRAHNLVLGSASRSNGPPICARTVALQNKAAKRARAEQGSTALFCARVHVRVSSKHARVQDTASQVHVPLPPLGLRRRHMI